jgi:hypothetical protein
MPATQFVLPSLQYLGFDVFVYVNELSELVFGDIRQFLINVFNVSG